jgi:hypothetical protein
VPAGACCGCAAAFGLADALLGFFKFFFFVAILFFS